MRPSVADRIGHIATAIGNIRKAVAGRTRESFANDVIARAAVERFLEVISEASRHIPPDVQTLEPGIHWRRLADLGNRLRHAYHESDVDLIWVMIEDDLEPLQIFVERIARELNR